MGLVVVFLLSVAVASALRSESVPWLAIWVFAVSAFLILLELRAGRP